MSKQLYSNATNAEVTPGTPGLTAIGTDGFTLGTNDNSNNSSESFVSWNWKAGNSQGSSNTDGSINTTYTSVNTTAGFSISKYTGTGSNATIGHGLGVAPKMIIFKNTNSTRDWAVYHASIQPGTPNAYDIGSASLEIGNVYIADDKRFYAGSDQNISLYHTSSNGINHLVGHPGNMFYHSATHYFTDAAQSQVYAQFIYNSYCELRHSGNTKLQTSTTGIDVTGEVAASQDYPTFRPTLDLNFAAEKKLDPRITYRRTGPASYVNQFGKVVLVGDNEPRFDYGYEFLAGNTYTIARDESKGLLLEDQKTNLFQQSIYMSNNDKVQTSGTVNDWSLLYQSGGAGSLTPGIDAPDGSNDAVRFTNNNSGNAILRLNLNAFTPNGSDTYALSFYVRAISGTGGMSCDLHDGAPQGTWTADLITNEWVRVVKTGVPSNGSKTFIDIMTNANNNRVFDVWGVQLENGAYASSFIPTRGATATRGKDLAEIDGEDFTEFFNQTEGTINCAYWLGNDNSGMRVFQINDSDNSVIDIVAGSGSGSGGYGYVNTGGVAQANGGQSSTNANYLNKLHVTTLAYKTNDIAGINRNTGVLTTDTSATLDGAYNRVTFYQNSNEGDQLNGHLQRVQYYPKRLPDNQLKNLNNQ